MKNITVVTTFHEPGLIKYGQNFIDSFSKNVDKSIKLHVYAENCTPVNPDSTQIIIHDAVESLPKLNRFKELWKDDPKANGECPFPHLRPKDYNKKFKWDAVRFANKVYAVFDACEKNEDWVVWMDADTIVHTPWSYEDFINCLPEDKWLTYVGRGKNSQNWPECGFYGLNMNKDTCKSFLKEFERMYEDAETGIFTLVEWHDSFVFGHILTNLRKKDPNVLDYSHDIVIKDAKSGGGGHPLINSRLGKWLDHLKGDRKDAGKSKKTDLVINRNKDYWG